MVQPAAKLYATATFLFLLASSACLPAHPRKTQDAPASTLSTGILQFLAFDKSEQPVIDLTREDLTLKIDKQAVKIVSISSITTQPVVLGIFFDISGSRHDDRHLIQEIDAIRRFVGAVWHHGDEGFVVGFTSVPVVAVPSTRDLQEMQAGIQNLASARYHGATALWDAICMPHLTPSSQANRLLVFIVVSDFEDNTSRSTKEEAESRMETYGVRLFPFLLLGDDFNQHEKRARRLGKQAADELARRTGGDVLEANSFADIEPLLRRLSSELQSRYQISYEQAPQARNNKKIELSSTRPGIKLLFPHR